MAKSDDIVVRLENWADINNDACEGDPITKDICETAADEIKRLRASLSRAEEALREIAGKGRTEVEADLAAMHASDGGSYQTGRSTGRDECARIARKVIAGDGSLETTP